MKKSYVKLVNEYKKSDTLDSESILKAIKRFKESPKKSTSISLDETTTQELKKIALNQGLPYQVLMRVFILEGLKKYKVK